MKAIEFNNVTFNYEGYDEKILKSVNFSVSYGEVSLLSGLSGEGKSTVLSLIAGIIPNVIAGDIEGDVLIDGVSNLGRKMSEICRKVGIVLQNADSQIIQKYVDDEIAFGCENFAFPADKIKAQVERTCKIMKLRKNWLTRSLSGGQKQRLITASALATGQKILVLDEPLANLDTDGAKLLMTTLRALAKAGYAVLVVEHRLDMVLPYVDTVWSIQSGEIKKVENTNEYLLSQTIVISDETIKHTDNRTLFELKNVAFKIKEKDILKSISFSINKGDRLLLLGENGCGKTTLLRLIAKLHRPSSGEITQKLDAKFSKGKNSKDWFKRVGVVYQNPNYQLFMPTVEKEVEFNAVSKEYADEIIKLFNIEHLRNRHPQSLSEGQKRRVSIAAVVAMNPEVLLLDEPTVGQDYKGLCELVEILNTLHEKTGNTIITVTHDMRCAEALCDKAVHIKDGVVAHIGGKDFVHEYFFGKETV